MRVYLDSSALVKRALLEDESAALIAAVERYVAQGVTLLSSTVSWIEVTRSLRSRLEDESPFDVADRVEVALSGIVECPISEQVTSIARRLGPSTLRSLDSIHLASASLLNVDVICAYDQRMLTAAAELGFRTISPT